MRATRVGNDTTLSQIVKLVHDAQTSKAPIQDVADKVASVFVPAIISLGAATFFFWLMLFVCTNYTPSAHVIGWYEKLYFAVKLGICVIVVACPCALGLATPTAIMVGTGIGAELGILIKGGEPLSIAQKLTKIVFDKTGTLTMGKMDVVKHEQNRKTGVQKVDDLSEQDFLGIVGTVEEASEHSIATSLLKYCQNAFIDSSAPNKVPLASSSSPSFSVSFPFALHSFESVPGSGVKAIVSNTMSVEFSVCIGNAEFLTSQGCAVSAAEIASIETQETLGLTVVLVGINETFCGQYELSDVVKPEAKETVDALKRLGFQVCMITGDQDLTARTIAKQCGIEEVYAGVSPGGKKVLVEQMQKRGEVVAMVGDGVNDSASIAQSDIGIAVFGGTDVTVEAANIVLMREDLTQIVTALDLCRAIYNRIILNFLWACGYNVLMVPIAMGVGIPFGISMHPIFAGMAMSLSSFSVVLSSLLLRSYKPPGVASPGEELDGWEEGDEEYKMGERGNNGNGSGNKNEKTVGSSNFATVKALIRRIIETLVYNDETSGEVDNTLVASASSETVSSTSSSLANPLLSRFNIGGIIDKIRGFVERRRYTQVGDDNV
ncbi:serine/threonine protein kinase Ran1 [Physocladia obscura]|uniref:P-type Cu(+) transporter n=1 Tax=Physocladia obscura TaxID=109957 RepID=A0AAD5SMY6_9FUNG|nr:serine/threonine protein kinase Ran1 [Physocladia obscura]